MCVSSSSMPLLLSSWLSSSHHHHCHHYHIIIIITIITTTIIIVSVVKPEIQYILNSEMKLWNRMPHRYTVVSFLLSRFMKHVLNPTLQEHIYIYYISHNAPFWNRNVHISVTKWCIVGYGTVALWGLWDGYKPWYNEKQQYIFTESILYKGMSPLCLQLFRVCQNYFKRK